jgi:hypothetical protein
MAPTTGWKLEDCFVDQGANLRWLLEQWGLCLVFNGQFIVFEEEMEWGSPGHFASTVQEQRTWKELEEKAKLRVEDEAAHRYERERDPP